MSSRKLVGERKINKIKRWRDREKEREEERDRGDLCVCGEKERQVCPYGSNGEVARQ